MDGKGDSVWVACYRAFANQEYEGYAQDSFKVTRNLTLSFGLRYSLFGVPYEMNGTQVVPRTSLSQYFGDRVGAQAIGIPNSILPTSMVTYVVGGPKNNAPGYYPINKKNFAPRLGIAFSPNNDSLLAKIEMEVSQMNGLRHYRIAIWNFVMVI